MNEWILLVIRGSRDSSLLHEILTAADGRDTNRLSNLLSQANRRFHDRRVSYSTFTWKSSCPSLVVESIGGWARTIEDWWNEKWNHIVLNFKLEISRDGRFPRQLNRLWNLQQNKGNLTSHRLCYLFQELVITCRFHRLMPWRVVWWNLKTKESHVWQPRCLKLCAAHLMLDSTLNAAGVPLEWMLRLSRSLSRFETQDIKTQPLFNQPFD